MADPDLSEFIEEAGAALAAAQSGLAGEELASTAMAVAEAELDIAVAIGEVGDGGVKIQPVSLADLTSGGLNPAGLSRVRLSYVAIADTQTADAGVQPTRKKADVLAEVMKDQGLRRLDDILGGLTVDASYIPASSRWLVVASDTSDNVVREIVVEDVKR